MKSGASFFMDGVASIETPDAQTVVATLDSPNSEYLGILAAPYTGITNSDLVAEQGANADPDATDTAERSAARSVASCEVLSRGPLRWRGRQGVVV